MTWPGHTQAGVDFKQGAVGKALDKAVFRVQKLVFLPVERGADMGAAVAVDEYFAPLAYGEELFFAEFNFLTAAVFCQLVEFAEQPVHFLLITFIGYRISMLQCVLPAEGET